MKLMRISNFTLILFASLLIYSCNGKKSDPVSTKGSTAETVVIGEDATMHFICPNHCKGSGGSQAGTCPVCGTEYVHNDAFHQGKDIPEPAMKIDPVTHMAVPTHTEAQNEKGVYHFICPKGDPGGAGVAGNCPKCGTPLEHNPAFHSH
jgi:hypothetical protein